MGELVSGFLVFQILKPCGSDITVDTRTMIELALNILRAGYLLLNMSRAVGVYFEVTSKQLCGGTGFWVSGFSNSEAVWL